MNKRRLRIAIQKSGRLNPPSIDFLGSLGLTFKPKTSSLMQECENMNLDILFLRDDDIPEFVSRGVADFGIVGKNVILEDRAEVDAVRELGFGLCRLAIAVPETSSIKKIADLEGERIATTYPYLLKKFLRDNNLEAAVIPITGSVEVTPELNLADAICDLVQSGSTLKSHKLTPIATVIESQAVLITSPSKNPEKDLFLQRLNQ